MKTKKTISKFIFILNIRKAFLKINFWKSQRKVLTNYVLLNKDTLEANHHKT